MRLLVGALRDSSENIAETKLVVGKPIELELKPTPARKMRVALVKDGRANVLVLLFE